MTSHGSTAAASEAEGPPKPAELDALQAEIETIKADIRILRVGAEGMHQTDILHTSDRQSDLPFRVEGSKIPAPINRQPAAKIGCGGSKRGGVKVLCSKARLATPAPSNINIKNPLFTTTTTPRSTHPSPHFAQPTQAATRRVHQTLRKDASPLKASPELSPGRSTKAKAPNFATDKRAAQRHQKRTSLPSTWTMSTPPKPESGELKHHPGDPDHTADHTAESEHSTMPSLNMTGSNIPFTNAQPAEQAPTPGSTSPQKLASPAKSSSAEQSPSIPPLRSYMMPTASAQRRSRAVANRASRDARIARQEEDLDQKLLELYEATHWSKSALAAYNFEVDAEEEARATRAPQQSAESETMPQAPFAVYSFAVDSADALDCPDESGIAGRRPSPEDSAEAPISAMSSAMRLPMPLPRVANTVVTRQEPDHNMLDSINEKLGDLLRHDPARYQPATNAHQGHLSDIPDHVLPHTNGQAYGGSADAPVGQTAMVAEAQPLAYPSFLDRSRYSLHNGQRHSSESGAAQDHSDDPISRLVSGLRGQSSANIGRALGSQQPSIPVTSDPAVLYQGPKPSSTMEAPQSSSLRATAMSFVPQTEPAQTNTSPVVSSLSPEEHPESNQAGDFGYLSDYHEQEPSYLSYDQDFISGETPAISPVSDTSLGERLAATESAPVSRFDVDSSQMSPRTFLAFQQTTPSMYGATGMDTTDGRAPWVTEAEILRRILEQPRTGPFPVAALRQTPTFTSMPSAPTPAVSPPEDVRGSPQWKIQGEGRRPFQWSGGGGMEITFQGIGPDAEHDPNRPVEYRDLLTNTSTVHSPRHRGARSTSPPTAPRSMREQAKRMSDSQVPRPDDQQEGQ